MTVPQITKLEVVVVIRVLQSRLLRLLANLVGQVSNLLEVIEGQSVEHLKNCVNVFAGWRSRGKHGADGVVRTKFIGLLQQLTRLLEDKRKMGAWTMKARAINQLAKLCGAEIGKAGGFDLAIPDGCKFCQSTGRDLSSAHR